MMNRTLAYFTVREDQIDEVIAALRQHLSSPGPSIEVYRVPYSNRFFVSLQEDSLGSRQEKEKLLAFLMPRFQELPEFIELELIVSR